MDTDGVVQLIILITLLILSGVFSSAETALSTVNRVKLKELAELGNKRAVTTLALLENAPKMLSTVLVCNNIVNLSASSLVTVMTSRIFGNNFVALATGILTFLLLIFGEITPKTLATLYSERLSLTFGPFISFLCHMLTPIIFVIDKISFAILALMHIDEKNARSAITEYEFRNLVEESVKDGVLEDEESEMITNVVDFGDSCAKDVMIPRVDMTCISANASLEELKKAFMEEKFTRLPVYEESSDDIIGIVNMKDMLFYDEKNEFSIRNIMREAHFTFEYKKTSDLLAEMRENSIAMSMVLDEYGATVGLVTLEDLLEEIVGEIRDEYDDYEKDLIKEIDERTYHVDGSMKLDDINNALDTEFESEDFDSIGGLVIEHLNDLPEEGEEVTLEDGTTLKVVEMDKNHIEQIEIVLSDNSDPDSEDEDVDADDASEDA